MWRNSRLNALWQVVSLLRETNGLLRELVQVHGRSTTPQVGLKAHADRKPIGPESLTYPAERERLAALQEEARRRAALGMSEG